MLKPSSVWFKSPQLQWDHIPHRIGKNRCHRDSSWTPPWPKGNQYGQPQRQVHQITCPDELPKVHDLGLIMRKHHQTRSKGGTFYTITGMYSSQMSRSWRIEKCRSYSRLKRPDNQMQGLIPDWILNQRKKFALKAIIGTIGKVFM